MNEIWKDIENYEDYYQVSNLGRIKSLERITTQLNNGIKCTHIYKGKILTTHKRTNNYLCVHLSKYGKTKWINVHRLVAETFIPNPQNKPQVNHIDNNPLNNRVDNLEWCTAKENMMWSSIQGRMKYQPNNLKKAQQSRKITVIAIDKDNNEFEFSSQTEASKILNCNRKHIGCICKNKYGYKTSNGYSFKYKEKKYEKFTK